MAHVEHPVTEEAFSADRQRMLNGFVNAATFSVVASIIILGLMGIFLL
jgi:hypothetical protein